MKSFGKMFLVLMMFATLTSTARAEEAAAPAAAAPTAEQQAQMDKMKAAMAPGEAHQVLASLAGKWNYTSKFWMSPEGAPEESSGTSEGAMIYGGRFLQETFSGKMGGQPFNGTAITGYDNVRAEYSGIWYDDMATGIMVSSGQFDPATKTLSMSGTMSCPMTGEKDRKSRMEHVITDNDHNTLVGYGFGPDGKEFKTMEIVYIRAS